MRVLLNGTVVRAQGIEDFTVKKIIDRDDRVFRYEFPGDLTIVEQGFQILKEARESNYCGSVDIDLQRKCKSGYKTIVAGEVRLTNMELNHYECTARVKVKERDFLSKILNSWDKETSVTGGKDLYDEDLTKLTAQSTVFTKPFDDVFYANVNTWDWLDAVQYYVDYLTGSGLTVRSDWYDALPSTQQIGITGGLNIRTPTTGACVVTSLERIYTDMAKMFNLYMGIVYNGNTPELRIEEEDFWFTDTFTNRDDILIIKDRFEEKLLYSSVKLGSSTYIRGDGTRGESFPDIPFFSFSDETFAISGSCNLDQSLDLSLRGIIDSNVIEDIIENSSETYDTDVIYVQIDTDGGVSAYQPDDQFLAGRAFYNPMFQKNEQVERFNFHGDVRRDIDLGADQYLAFYPNAPTVPILTGTSQLVFPNDSVLPGYDTDNNYNTSTSRYTAPDNDIYTFQLQFLYRILQRNAANTIPLFLRGAVRVFNSSNVLKQTYLGQKVLYYLEGVNPFPSDVHFVRDYYNIFMEATDYVQFYIGASVTDGVNTDSLILVSPGTIGGVVNYQFSECVTTKNAGGLIRQSDPDTYKVRQWEFDDELSVDELTEFMQQPQKGMRFGGLNVPPRNGWGEIETTISTGKTTFTLLSDTN